MKYTAIGLLSGVSIWRKMAPLLLSAAVGSPLWAGPISTTYQISCSGGSNINRTVVGTPNINLTETCLDANGRTVTYTSQGSGTGTVNGAGLIFDFFSDFTGSNQPYAPDLYTVGAQQEFVLVGGTGSARVEFTVGKEPQAYLDLNGFTLSVTRTLTFGTPFTIDFSGFGRSGSPGPQRMWGSVYVSGIYVNPDPRDNTLFVGADIMPTAAAVPEPATGLLLAVPALWLAARRRQSPPAA